MIRKDITAERLRELVDYDPETGVMTSRVTRYGYKPGDKLGSLGQAGYLLLQIEGCKSSIHRFAWLYVYGEWPKHEIDHINGVRTDNRIRNLRDATDRDNAQNLNGAKSNSTLGILGVSPSKYGKPYLAQIQVDGKVYALGRYDTPQEAKAAYMAAKRLVHVKQLSPKT